MSQNRKRRWKLRTFGQWRSKFGELWSTNSEDRGGSLWEVNRKAHSDLHNDAPRYVWMPISLKPWEIEPCCQRSTNTKWHPGYKMVTWPMTSRDLERSRSWPQDLWGPLARKRLKIQTRVQWGTYGKWQLEYQIVTSPILSRDPTG